VKKLRQNFSDNWFGVIKNQPSNPHSLYPYEEIVEMFETKEENEKLYGYHPIKYIGNLVGFRNLKGDYLYSNDFSRMMPLDNLKYNFGITQITFLLQVGMEEKTKLVRFNLQLRVSSVGADTTVDLLRNIIITKEMYKDFVDIYNMPNHKYKNIHANISPYGIKKLKNIFIEDELYDYLTEDGVAISEILRELKL